MQDCQNAVVSQSIQEEPRSIGAGRMETPMPPNKIMDIHITACSHGYVVAVGCSNFAIEKASDLIAKLSEYLNNPAETVRKWNDGKLF